MINKEMEEYNVSEIESINEFQYFEAEDFKTLENINNEMEEFKVSEIGNKDFDEAPKLKKNDNYKELRKKLNHLKTSINTTATTALSTSVIVVAAIGVGAIVLDEPKVDFGSVEFLNYSLEYLVENDSLFQNVRLHFDKELNDDFYTVVVNKETNETKNLNYNFITFYDVSSNPSFDVITKNKKDEIIDVFEIDLVTSSNTQYLGIGDMNYNIINNDDETISLELEIEENVEGLIPKAYLSDYDGNDLNYESSFLDNKITIYNIKDRKFNLDAYLYQEENGNYYAVKSYKIHNYNVNSPISVNLDRVEVLNESYSYDGSIPTQLYFDGYLSENDYLDIEVYNKSGDKLDEHLNVKDFLNPIVFSNLSTEEDVLFKYKLYHYKNIIQKGEYETSLIIKNEYLDASYDFNSLNPNDIMATYNGDGTYNSYFYTAFVNNSEYDLVYKVELSCEDISYYEYIGNDYIAYIDNIKPGMQFSLINKVFVKENKTYYSIYNFYLASGSFGVDYQDGKWQTNTHLEIIPIENKIYQLQTNQDIKEDVLVTVTLSNGQIVEFVLTKESFEDSSIIDLSNYEYTSVRFEVKIMVNGAYGLGDLILAEGIDIIGDLYIEEILEFEF